jgi:hypothetical protein
MPKVPVNVSYSIDNVQGTAMGLPAGGNTWNQTLFREEGLANVQHTLRVEILSRFLIPYMYDTAALRPR